MEVFITHTKLVTYLPDIETKETFISANYRVIPVECAMFLQPSSKDKIR